MILAPMAVKAKGQSVYVSRYFRHLPQQRTGPTLPRAPPRVLLPLRTMKSGRANTNRHAGDELHFRFVCFVSQEQRSAVI